MGFYDPSGKWRRHLTEADGERVLEFLGEPNASGRASLSNAAQRAPTASREWTRRHRRGRCPEVIA